MNRTRSLVFALVAACGVAWGADYYDGLAAFKAGDYETALEQWTPLAEAGFPDAQYQLARMYHRGYAVQDDAEAARLYRLAADRNHTMAQNNLGVMYEQGRGVERDEAEAARWYLKAAQNGLTVAQANLAVLYDEGRGVDSNPRTAAEWYRLAGESGHATSQYRLALLFEDGRGVDASDGKAANWFRKAAKQGHAQAQLALSRMYAEGRGVKRNASKAAKWSRLATMQGLEASPAASTVAASAPAVASAPETAEPEQDAEPGAPEALGGETETRTQGQDPAGSAAAGAAALAGGAEAEIGQVSGQIDAPAPAVAYPAAAPLPPPADEVLAPALAETFDAAEAGDVDAQYELARRFETGDGLPLSHKEAGKWYLAAAERGHGFAGYKLAFQYFRGRGIAKGKDMLQAYFWFSVSEDRGVGDSAAWRDRVAKKLTKRQVAQAEEMLTEWNAR